MISQISTFPCILLPTVRLDFIAVQFDSKAETKLLLVAVCTNWGWCLVVLKSVGQVVKFNFGIQRLVDASMEKMKLVNIAITITILY